MTFIPGEYIRRALLHCAAARANRLMIRPEPWLRRSLRLAGDLAVALAAFYAAFWLRIHLPLPFTLSLLPPDRLGLYGPDWGLAVLCQPLALYLVGLYDPPYPRSFADLTRKLAPAIAIQGLILGSYYFLAGRSFPRSVLLAFLLLNFLLLALWRLLLRSRAVVVPRRVAIVGHGPAAVELAEKVRNLPGASLVLTGWVPAGNGTNGDPIPAVLGPRLGELDDLPGYLASGEVDDIVLAVDAEPWQTRLLDTLSERGARGSVLLLPGPFDSLIGRMRYRWVQDLPLIEVVRDSEWRPSHPAKRALDLTVGTALLALASPVMLGCALLVRLTSPGPVFYRQERLGRGQRRFTLWKFRTMKVDAERETGEVLAVPDDPRLTPGGATLRRLRLDELPQLLNVLAGSMSLVGPRPERPGFVERYIQEVPGYVERFAVPPGLTGLAQVNGEYHSTAQNKLRYDLAYIANWSLWLDLVILLRTVKIVVTSRGV